MPTIRSLYELHATQAQQESLSYEQYLYELALKECEVRCQKRMERWLKESKLPLEKTLEAFDRSRLSRKLNQQVNTLLKGAFLKKAENTLSFGNPGSGKTHLLSAIAQELIRQGHRVYFRSCNLLVQDLLIAKQELRPDISKA